MTGAELNELRQQHENGARIQAYVQSFITFSPAWVDVAFPMWLGGTIYRVKPEQTK